jgi:hypothetical protein
MPCVWTLLDGDPFEQISCESTGGAQSAAFSGFIFPGLESEHAAMLDSDYVFRLSSCFT